jgi:hypothetical protein
MATVIIGSLCNLLTPFLLFIGTFFPVRLLYVEDGRGEFMGNAGTCILNYMMSNTRVQSRGLPNYSSVSVRNVASSKLSFSCEWKFTNKIISSDEYKI